MPAMAAPFPYTHYTCSCTDSTATKASATASRRTSNLQPLPDDEEEQTFNPHDPRANYSLYPLDHLLYCDECEAVRCPRCYAEEILSWYCPSCLFEVPSSGVKSDGNRCSRNCYDCPICAAPVQVAALPKSSNDLLQPEGAADGPFILQCQYCGWSTLEIDVKFKLSTKITEQLAKHRKARLSGDNVSVDGHAPETAFNNLTTFYKEQLNELGDGQNPYSNSPYSSPANLARIMSLYGGLSVNALKKSRERPQPMREAREQNEGLKKYGLLDEYAEHDLLAGLRDKPWGETTTLQQRLAAPLNSDAHLTNNLWPVATQLRTRKGRRCRTCRQFLSRVEPKPDRLRYKIRLLASHHIPRLSVRALHTIPQITNAAFRLRTDDAPQADLQPHATHQYILTVRNPIFEPIKVTLATPATTPGRVASRVTILCPSFTVGPAGDVWDEALSSNTPSMRSNDGGRQAALSSLTGGGENERQPEAGKVWEKTRSSTSVVLEIVPGGLKTTQSIVPQTDSEKEQERFDEGDEVLEVPVFVRAEWEALIEEEGQGGKKEGKGERVQKEAAFWCVLGIGRIADV